MESQWRKTPPDVALWILTHLYAPIYGEEGLGETTQLIKCLLCKHEEDLDLSPSAHMKKPGMVCMPIFPVLGKWRLRDP